MKDNTANRIKQLLNDSGSLPFYKKKPNSFTNHDFSKENILITGAAGTIGSGLVNQLIHSSFKQLILIDNAETSLYFLMKDLDIPNKKNIHFLILDIRDKDSMEWLFKTFKPSLIFHAAAYKHVSLTEDNPYEAIKLNVFATKLLADLAIEHKTKTFVYVSTDKAVNPISVMGMTKFIAEKYLDSVSFHKRTYFLTTRFGNIFGSNGSVVPLFIKQIESGKQISVTSEDTTRYFIDTKKACNLMLKAATMPELRENKIAFNMGEPIKIIDLASILLEIYNFKSQIKITGLEPGEKLHESLISESETLKATSDKDIFEICIKHNDTSNPIDLSNLYEIDHYKTASDIKDILASYI